LIQSIYLFSFPLVIDFCNHHKNDSEQESIDDDDADDDSK
jgi:hypothetical protein